MIPFRILQDVKINHPCEIKSKASAILNILFITRGYPSEKYKMNGIFEFDQAKALVDAGHEVIYAAVDLRSLRRFRKFGFESFIKDGVQIEAINIPCGRLPKRILKKIQVSALRILYARIVKKYGKPDIIHSHFIGSGYASVRVFQDETIPLVHTEHYSGMNQIELSDYYQDLGKCTYKNMHKVIAVSSYLSNNIKDKFGIDSTVIPNIADLSNFQYKQRKKKCDLFQFISVGSLTKNKRMDLLIESFSDAFAGKDNVRLFIFGEGPERKNLEAIISAHKLSKQVFLMGLEDRKAISTKMLECHCFVLASELETFGVAYIEAMATGLPVIATKCGGPEDFINESNGILVKKNDRNQLSEALLDMYDKATTDYNGSEISQDIKEKFAPLTIIRQIENLYSEIMSKEYKL